MIKQPLDKSIVHGDKSKEDVQGWAMNLMAVLFRDMPEHNDHACCNCIQLS
jgi:hypothetical protein